MREDRDRWNRKYSDTEKPVGPKGEPELIDHKALLPNHGLAAELACGRGANALYLASLGLTVLAVDGAINGLRGCQDAATAQNLPVSPVVMDLDKPGLAPGALSMISVVRYLDRALFPLLCDALAPTGVVFYKTFNRNHLESSPGFNPAFLLEPGELLRRFQGLDVLQHDESGPTSWILARRRAHQPSSVLLDTAFGYGRVLIFAL